MSIPNPATTPLPLLWLLSMGILSPFCEQQEESCWPTFLKKREEEGGGGVGDRRGGAPKFMCACKKKKLGGWRKLTRKVKMWEKQIRGGELVPGLMELDAELRLQEKANFALNSTV